MTCDISSICFHFICWIPFRQTAATAILTFQQTGHTLCQLPHAYDALHAQHRTLSSLWWTDPKKRSGIAQSIMVTFFYTVTFCWWLSFYYVWPFPGLHLFLVFSDNCTLWNLMNGIKVASSRWQLLISKTQTTPFHPYQIVARLWHSWQSCRF